MPAVDFTDLNNISSKGVITPKVSVATPSYSGTGGFVNNQGNYVPSPNAGYSSTSLIPANSTKSPQVAAATPTGVPTTSPQIGSPSGIVPVTTSSTLPTTNSTVPPGSPQAAATQQAADMQKYFPNLHRTLTSSGTPSPDSGGAARDAISSNSPTPVSSPDPTTTAVNQTATDLFNDTAQRNNVESTTQSLQDYTNQASAELGIPAMKTDLMNIQNVMSGTDHDVRAEITAAGGFATESQIEGIVAGRNQVLLLKASNLQNALTNAQDTLSTQVSAFGADRANTINALNDKISGDQSALSLFQNIQSQSVASYDKIFTAGGWDALATGLDANGKSLYEQTHGLPAGALSDPKWVAGQQALLYKQQAQALAYQRETLGIDRYNSSLGNPTPAPDPLSPPSGSNGGGVMSGTSGTGISHIIPADAPLTSIVPNTGGMSVAAVQLAARQFMVTGTNSVTNKFGKAAIANEASVIQTELGLSDSDVVTMRESYKADLASLTNIQTNADAAQSSETKTNLNLKLAQSLSASVPRTGSPIANNYDLWAKGQLKGDVNTVKFETAVYTAATEYAKVVGGSPGGGGSLTDSARAEADKLLSAAYNKDQFDGVVGIMQQDMSNTITSYGTQIKDIKSRTLGGGQTPTGDISSQAASKGFDYQAMISAGYNDQQIQDFLNQN